MSDSSLVVYRTPWEYDTFLWTVTGNGNFYIQGSDPPFLSRAVNQRTRWLYRSKHGRKPPYLGIFAQKVLGNRPKRPSHLCLPHLLNTTHATSPTKKNVPFVCFLNSKSERIQIVGKTPNLHLPKISWFISSADNLKWIYQRWTSSRRGVANPNFGFTQLDYCYFFLCCRDLHYAKQEVRKHSSTRGVFFFFIKRNNFIFGLTKCGMWAIRGTAGSTHKETWQITVSL